MASHGGAATAAGPDRDYVNVGLFPDAAEARRVSAALERYGQVRSARIPSANGTMMAELSVVPSAGVDTDSVLEAAWRAGAANAFTVRVEDQ